ncbi:S8 family peptidase [Thermomonospora umbrina]|uniref:Subtilisin family serine protease n=1 Tax=Thermomonospora umbrina TaxID=111806 RepID=A0A3D9T5B8_9ACTN|nr:S8 family peptidase [Thermomonospora umbrina]REE99904.1 subtilisin family serine protease [Thermomonospora umbrina]
MTNPLTHRRGAGGVLLAGALVLGMLPGTASAESPPSPPASIQEPSSHRVTLVTGDTVTLRGAAISVRPGPGRSRVRFQRSMQDGHHHVIPSDALPLLAAGRVDRRLFDVTRLVRWGYDDARRASVPLVVERTAGVSAASVPGLKVSRSLPGLGVDAAEAPKSGAADVWRRLTSTAGVTRISLDGRRTALLDRSTRQIGAPAAWKKGLTGKGVTVGVLDTGVDGTHPDLRGVVAKARGFTDRGPSVVKDGDGHGTHVASTVAGRGTASKGAYRGVAPGARVVSAKVLNDEGSGYDSWILAGMEWAVTQGGAKIVNLSLGGEDTPDLDVLERGVNTLSARTGALFVIAAGNEGGHQTISSPGSADAALTVGAIDRRGLLAEFSSRGPRVGDGAVKPDVTAPGVGIAAARATGAPADAPVGTRYQRLSGTSMATPHVVGAAAILAQRHPRWKGHRLKAALIGSAVPNPKANGLQQGAGRVDVPRALATRVTASPGNVSTYLRWGRNGATRQVTYTNDTNAPITLRLALKVDQKAGAGAFKLDRRTLKVPARGSATARLTLSRGKNRPGAYSGVVTATASGISVRTLVGVHIEPKSHDVALTAVDDRGRPSFGNITLVNKTSGRTFDAYFDGSLKMRVPDGDYTMHGTVLPEGCAPAMLYSRPLKVTADASVKLDVRQGKTVRTTLDDATARIVGLWEVGMAFTTKHEHFEEGVLADCPQGAMRVLPTEQQNLRFQTRTTWEKKGSTEAAPSPYRYELRDYRVGGLPSDPIYRARAADLAVVKTIFKGQGVPTTAYPWLGAELPGFDSMSWSATSTRMPFRQTYHLTSDPRFRWHQSLEYGASRADSPTLSGVITEPPRRFVKGAAFTQTWNAAVIGPGVTGHLVDAFAPEPFGQRWRDSLAIGASGVFGDGAPHRYGHDRAATGTMSLARNGKVVTTKPLKDGLLLVDVPASAADYTVTTSARRSVSYSRLATRVDAEWRFRSARTAKVSPLPLRSVGFAPNGLDDLNRARPGSTTSVPIWVDANQGTGPVKVTTLKVWSSADDGRTWRRVALTEAGGGWTTELRNPSSGFVSLRAEMTDASGNSVKQTVIRAYAIGG